MSAGGVVVPLADRPGRREREVLRLAREHGWPPGHVRVVLARKVAARVDRPAACDDDADLAELVAVLVDLIGDLTGP